MALSFNFSKSTPVSKPEMLASVPQCLNQKLAKRKEYRRICASPDNQSA